MFLRSCPWCSMTCGVGAPGRWRSCMRNLSRSLRASLELALPPSSPRCTLRSAPEPAGRPGWLEGMRWAAEGAYRIARELWCAVGMASGCLARSCAQCESVFASVGASASWCLEVNFVVMGGAGAVLHVAMCVTITVYVGYRGEAGSDGGVLGDFAGNL